MVSVADAVGDIRPVGDVVCERRKEASVDGRGADENDVEKFV